MKAVYIGRFQPCTKMHREVIQFIESVPDITEISIVKGSSQWSDQNLDPDSRPSRNPFNVKECCDMIKLSLGSRIKKPWRIVQVADTATRFTDPFWQEWIASIVAAMETPNFVVYTNNHREAEAFRRAGCQSRPFPVLHPSFSATDVRREMGAGKEERWRKWVDPEVADYLEKIQGSARLARLFELENN